MKTDFAILASLAALVALNALVTNQSFQDKLSNVINGEQETREDTEYDPVKPPVLETPPRESSGGNDGESIQPSQENPCCPNTQSQVPARQLVIVVPERRYQSQCAVRATYTYPRRVGCGH